MADETIRTLFNKVDDLTVQTTRIETLLVETVIANQKANSERLNRHREDINKAFDEINQLKHAKEKVISFKNLVVGFIGLVATCTTIAISIVQIMEK